MLADPVIGDIAVAKPDRFDTPALEPLLNATIMPSPEPSADLALTAHARVGRVTPASPVTFQFTITNNNGSDAASARLVGVIPTGWTVLGAPVAWAAASPRAGRA